MIYRALIWRMAGHDLKDSPDWESVLLEQLKDGLDSLPQICHLGIWPSRRVASWNIQHRPLWRSTREIVQLATQWGVQVMCLQDINSSWNGSRDTGREKGSNFCVLVGTSRRAGTLLGATMECLSKGQVRSEYWYLVICGRASIVSVYLPDKVEAGVEEDSGPFCMA